MRATRATGTLLTAVALGLLLATPTLADGGHGGENGDNHKIPELDPGVAGSAAVLLIGGTLILAGRRRGGAQT
jgi:hypothetical protein